MKKTKKKLSYLGHKPGTSSQRKLYNLNLIHSQKRRAEFRHTTLYLYLIIIIHSSRVDFDLQDLRFEEGFIAAHKSLYLTFGNSIALNLFS